MCGIYGVLNPRVDVRAWMDRARDLLRPRGPDGEGACRHESAALGHLRLAVIDTSAGGRQPMEDADGHACVTYNGEVYGFRELRLECEARGRSFRSSSDTEVLLHLYLLEGEAAFSRLDGIFAFCLVDLRTRTAYLVRDPAGVKPLYYRPTPRGLFFSSTLGPLRTVPGESATVDREALRAYLQLDYVPAPMAMVQGVRKLPGGHLLRVPAEGVPTLVPYAPAPSPSPAPPAPEDVEELGRLLDATVEQQLIADVPTGIFLSGGLDSSLVAESAARKAGRRVSTFSIGFDDPSYDERPHAAAVAERIGSEHHVQVLAVRDALDLLPRIPLLADEPLADGSILPTHLLSAFTRRSVTVALSGDGGDELFAGYPTYVVSRAGAIASRLPRRLRAGLLSAVHSLIPVRRTDLSMEFLAKKFLAGLHVHPVLRHQRWLGSFLPEDLPELLGEDDAAAQSRLEALLVGPAAAALDPLEALLATDRRFYLQDQTLVKVDRASMARALEVRVPLLARAVVAFARSLPAERKLHGRSTKVILRELARRRGLPPSIVDRPKKGFGIPLSRWFRADLRELLCDSLSPGRLEKDGLFRAPAVQRLLAEHLSGRRDHRKKLFNLLTFVLWRDSALASEGAVA